MNRKLVNGLLLLTLTAGACSTFTSCKDTDEDFKNEVIADQAALRTELLKLLEEYRCMCPNDADALLDKLRTFLANPTDENGAMNAAIMQVIKGYVDGKYAALGDFNSLKAAYDAFAGQNGTYETFVSQYNTWKAGVDSFKSSFETWQTEANGKFTTLGNQLAAIETRLANDSVLTAVAIDSLGNVVDGLGNNLNSLGLTVDAMGNVVDSLGNAVTNINTQLDGIHDELGDIKGNIRDLQSQMYTALEYALGAYNSVIDLDAALQELQGTVDKLQPQISSLSTRLNKFITSLEVSQTYNHLFGTFNLPIGVESRVVAQYYGYVSGQVTFPFGSAAEVTLDPETQMSEYAPKGNIPTITVNGLYNEESTNNLGQLYTTINPNNINYNGNELKLVRSNGQAAPVKLVAKTTDEVLMFGATRSEENPNGFYRVEAQVTPVQAQQLKGELNVEPGLKSAFKDAIKNHSKTDIAKLAKVVVDQLSGVVPAYAVKAEWSVNETNAQGVTETKTYGVVSKYDIMATAIKPLGYEFLADGAPTARRFRTFGPITEVFDRMFNDLRKDIKIDLGLKEIEGIKLDSIAIDLSHVDVKLENVQGIDITIPRTDIKIPVTNPITGDVTYSYPEEDITINLTYNEDGSVGAKGDGALNNLIKSIQESINKIFADNGPGSLTEELNNQINEQITDKLGSQVDQMVADINEMLGGMQGRLDGQIKDILDKIHDQVAGKLHYADKVVDLYNRVAEKLNKFLDNPHYYLQAAAFYKDGNGSLHRLSNDAHQPSQFVAGNGNALTLFCSSLTGDVVVPSFKKYVAICDMNGNIVDQILTTGRQQEFAFSAPRAGKYRVVYSSLDYRGQTSTCVSYINVR